MEAEWDPLDPVGEIKWLEKLNFKYGYTKNVDEHRPF